MLKSKIGQTVLLTLLQTYRDELLRKINGSEKIDPMSKVQLTIVVAEVSTEIEHELLKK